MATKKKRIDPNVDILIFAINFRYCAKINIRKYKIQKHKQYNKIQQGYFFVDVYLVDVYGFTC